MDKKIKFIFSIGVSIFIFGCLWYFISLAFSDNDSNSEYENSTNKKIEFQQEQCSEDMCINSVVITLKDGESYITGTIVNNSNADISNGIVKLVFELDDGREINHYYGYSSLKSKEEVSFEIVLPIDYAVTATEYSIEKLTEEEIAKYNSAME